MWEHIRNLLDNLAIRMLFYRGLFSDNFGENRLEVFLMLLFFFCCKMLQTVALLQITCRLIFDKRWSARSIYQNPWGIAVRLRTRLKQCVSRHRLWWNTRNSSAQFGYVVLGSKSWTNIYCLGDFSGCLLKLLAQKIMMVSISTFPLFSVLLKENSSFSL